MDKVNVLIVSARAYVKYEKMILYEKFILKKNVAACDIKMCECMKIIFTWNMKVQVMRNEQMCKNKYLR